MWQRACHNAYVVHAFEAADRRRPFALNFCRGSAPWQRLVQSGFYEVALTLLFPGTVVPCDLTEPSRFPNRPRHDSRWQTEGGLPWATLLRCGRTIPPARFADLPSERKTLRRRDGC